MRMIVGKTLVIATILRVTQLQNPIEQIPSNLMECIIRRKPHIKPNFGRRSYDTGQHSRNDNTDEQRHYSNADLSAFVIRLQSDSPNSSTYDLVSNIGNCAQIMKALNTFLSDSLSKEEI